MFWIIGGTINAREIATMLLQRGISVLVTTTTELGSSLAQQAGLEVLQASLTYEDMLQLIQNKKINMVIDASHPFATEVSLNAIKASAEMGIEYLRFERKQEQIEGVYSFSSYPDIVEYLKNTQGNILLTIGSKHVSQFTSLGTNRLFARVLPVNQSLDLCKDAGIPSRNVLALGGAFSVEFNKAMMNEFDIRFLVTKESGEDGGVREKTEAAKLVGAEVVMLQRPTVDYPNFVNTYEEILHHIKTRF